jgi:arylsulfatase A-like enzyme
MFLYRAWLGVKLMRHYVHAECTPTRVSFQTGRLPMHSGQVASTASHGPDGPQSY